ncbi:hypothetical protein [Vulcanisaeta sp. JCM 16159]|uniref:hypothetical protein n=1 Tax=Vulcanisaeta sp. JCM 16159 TaxID=1295371 RepID=UPI001FB2039C|nr:hypothetical protein [Vulcanisaeta sp. JCM 16159]
MAMSYTTRFWTLFIINLVISFALAYAGYWLLIAALGLIIGYVLNSDKASSAFICTGVSVHRRLSRYFHESVCDI